MAPQGLPASVPQGTRPSQRVWDRDALEAWAKRGGTSDAEQRQAAVAIELPEVVLAVEKLMHAYQEMSKRLDICEGAMRAMLNSQKALEARNAANVEQIVEMGDQFTERFERAESRLMRAEGSIGVEGDVEK